MATSAMSYPQWTEGEQAVPFICYQLCIPLQQFSCAKCMKINL